MGEPAGEGGEGELCCAWDDDPMAGAFVVAQRDAGSSDTSSSLDWSLFLTDFGSEGRSPQVLHPVVEVASSPKVLDPAVEVAPSAAILIPKEEEPALQPLGGRVLSEASPSSLGMHHEILQIDHHLQQNTSAIITTGDERRASRFFARGTLHTKQFLDTYSVLWQQGVRWGLDDVLELNGKSSGSKSGILITDLSPSYPRHQDSTLAPHEKFTDGAVDLTNNFQGSKESDIVAGICSSIQQRSQNPILQMKQAQQSFLSSRLAAALSAIQSPQATRGTASQQFNLPSFLHKSSSTVLPKKRNLDSSLQSAFSPTVSSENERRKQLAIQGPPVRGLQDSSIGEGFAFSNASRIKQRLLLMAQALDQKNMAVYDDLKVQLHPHMKPRGRAIGRTVNALVMALEAKREGRGDAEFREERQNLPKMQDQSNAIIWYYTAHPASPVTFNFISSTILPVLMGKPKVHIIFVGVLFVPHIPVFMEILAKQKPRSGVEGPTLRKMRVTLINTMPLVRPLDNEDLHFGWAGVAARLKELAASLKLPFSFQYLALGEENLDCLGLLNREPGETLAVCDNCEFQHFHDVSSTAGSPLQRVMECLARLNPEIMSFAEPDYEAGGESFVPRFEAILDQTWLFFDSLDACVKKEGAKWLRIVENAHWIRHMYCTIACEGSQRKVRPRSHQTWLRLFEFWGFQVQPVHVGIKKNLHNLLQGFPPGFSIGQDGASVTIDWRGYSLGAFGAVTPGS